MLIILSGVPGAGKTTVARRIAKQIGAVHLQIDAIEQAIRRSGVVPAGHDADSYRAAYEVAYALAGENLRLGRKVIADCVNPILATRDAWLAVAKGAGVDAIEVEIRCSDDAVLRSRLDRGTTDLEAGRAPRWQDVARHYERWTREHIIVDTAHLSVEKTVEQLRRALATPPLDA